MANAPTMRIEIEQGSMWTRQLLWIGSNRAAVDCTEYYAEMAMREDPADAAALIELSEVNGRVYNQGTSGLGFSLTAAETAALDFENGYFDIEITPVSSGYIKPSQVYLGLGFLEISASHDSTHWMYIWPVGRIAGWRMGNWSDIVPLVFLKYFDLDPTGYNTDSAAYTMADAAEMDADDLVVFSIANSDSGNDGYYIASQITRWGIVASRFPGSESGLDSGSGTNDLQIQKYENASPANSQTMSSGVTITVTNDDGGATKIACSGWNPTTALSLSGGEVLKVINRATQHDFVGVVASSDATSITFTDILHVANDAVADDGATITELSATADYLEVADGFHYLDIDVDAKTITAVSEGGSNTLSPWVHCDGHLAAGDIIRITDSQGNNDGTYEVASVVDDVVTVTRTIEGIDSVTAAMPKGDPQAYVELLVLATGSTRKLVRGTVRLTKEVTK